MTTMHNPPHPVDTLREDVLPALGLTVTDAAAQLGVTRAALFRVLNCRAAISPEMALRIGEAPAAHTPPVSAKKRGRGRPRRGEVRPPAEVSPLQRIDKRQFLALRRNPCPMGDLAACVDLKCQTRV